jgi:hypothetical protein
MNIARQHVAHSSHAKFFLNFETALNYETLLASSLTLGYGFFNPSVKHRIKKNHTVGFK